MPMRKRYPREMLADMSHLGIGGSQKLSPGGKLIKKIPHLNRRTLIAAAWLYLALFTAVNTNAVCLYRVRCLTYHTYPANRPVQFSPIHA